MSTIIYLVWGNQRAGKSAIHWQTNLLSPFINLSILKSGSFEQLWYACKIDELSNYHLDGEEQSTKGRWNKGPQGEDQDNKTMLSEAANDKEAVHPSFHLAHYPNSN